MDPEENDVKQQAEEDSQGQQAGDEVQNQQAEDEGSVGDSHGQPGINKERHDKEVAELQAKIDALTAQVADAAEQKSKRADFEKQVADLKAELADSNVTHALEMAGCLNPKAAKVLLDDYSGDVAKLKAACPYLFGSERKTGSTGKRTAGTAEALDDKLDRAFGLKK